MKRLILWLTLFTALLALAACAAEEKATPSPSTAPTAAGKPAWEQEWERVLAAAKQEGKLSLMMPTGAATRQPLTEPFEKKYGITVEYQQGSGAEQIQKVRAERAAGQYLWDLWIGGHTDMIVAKNQGMLDPMEAALILPEVKDSKNWLGGKMEFSDNEGKFVLIMGAYSGANIMVNTDLVDPKTITSYRDLLDPKWKGKILMDDPRIGGSANSSFGFFYQNKALGPDFIKALLAQDITYNRDNELQLQWLAQGKYPICIGCSTRRAAQMKNEGVKNIGEPGASQMKEGGTLHGGSSIVSLFNRPPHPNATKVYINWLLTKEAQTQFLKAQDHGSRRVDVAAEWLDASKRANIGKDTPVYTEQFIKPIDEMRAFLDSLMR